MIQIDDIFISGQNDQEHLINLEVVLLRENVPWKWGKKEKDSFERVKRLSCLFRLLVHYDTIWYRRYYTPIT